MDTVYCSLPIVESQLNDPHYEFADLILCRTCDMNGELVGEGEVPFTPNGIPDGQYELGVLAGILNDPTHPLHTTATNAFKYNFRIIKDVLILALSDYEGVDLRNMLNSFAPHLVGGLAALFAGYAAMGDQQTNAAMDELFLLLESVGIEPWEGGVGANMWSQPATGPNGDANTDGFSNAIAYHWYVGVHEYSPEDYVFAAISPSIKMELMTLSGGGVHIIGDDILLESHLVGATPVGPYVWYKNTVEIPLEEGAVLSIQDVDASDDGAYKSEVEVALTFMENTNMTLSASTDVQVLPPDTTPPEILQCAPNQTITVNGVCQATVPDFRTQVIAQDDRTSTENLVIVQSPSVGSIVNSGNKTITLTVYDEAGNSTPCQAILTANDVTPPVITLQEKHRWWLNSVHLILMPELRQPIIIDGNLNAVQASGLPNTSVVGTTLITILFVMWLTMTLTRCTHVNVVIPRPYAESVLVSPSHTVQVTSKIMGTGVLGPSNCDFGTGRGTLTLNPNTVDYVAPRIYRLTWNCPGIMKNGGNVTVTVNGVVADEYGNLMAAPFERTHIAGGVSAMPVITLLGNNPQTVECGSTYQNPGATAVDACGTDLTAVVAVSGDAVNTAVKGTYTVAYNVIGAMNRGTSYTHRKYCRYNTAANNAFGQSTVIVECGFNFTDAGATALVPVMAT